MSKLTKSCLLVLVSIGIGLIFAGQLRLLTLISGMKMSWPDALKWELTRWCLWPILIPIILWFCRSRLYYFYSKKRFFYIEHLLASIVISLCHLVMFSVVFWFLAQFIKAFESGKPLWEALTVGPDRDQRAPVAKVFLPIELFPRPSEECYFKSFESYASSFCKDSVRAITLSRIGAKSDPYVAWDYGAELLTTDLSDEIGQLKVPLLVVPPIPDNTSATQSPDPISLSQWKKLKMPNLTIVPLKNTRAYATEDSPELLDQTIANFLRAK